MGNKQSGDRSNSSNYSNHVVSSSNNRLMDKVEFSYTNDFLENAEKFGKELAGPNHVDLGKSQLRKFYDQVISLRNEVLQKTLSNKNNNSNEIIRDEIIFKLKLLQSRVIYLTMRKSGNRKLITENSKKYLLGILERGISLCKRKDIELNKSMKQFVMEFEAIYAFFYTLAEKD